MRHTARREIFHTLDAAATYVEARALVSRFRLSGATPETDVEHRAVQKACRLALEAPADYSLNDEKLRQLPDDYLRQLEDTLGSLLT